MQWIKSTERIPKPWSGDKLVRSTLTGNVDMMDNWNHPDGWGIGSHFPFFYVNTEWLDESEPSFTLQNMIDAYEEGEQESCNAHTGSKSAHVGRRKWFLDNFNIDLNKHK